MPVDEIVQMAAAGAANRRSMKLLTARTTNGAVDRSGNGVKWCL